MLNFLPVGNLDNNLKKRWLNKSIFLLIHNDLLKQEINVDKSQLINLLFDLIYILILPIYLPHQSRKPRYIFDLNKHFFRYFWQLSGISTYGINFIEILPSLQVIKQPRLQRLTHLFQIHPFSTPLKTSENLTVCNLRVHWKQMG